MEVEMDTSEHDLDDDRKAMTQGQAAGGGSSRGPDINPGGDIEPGGAVPPYDIDASEQDQAAASDGVHKAFRAEENAPAPGEAAPESTQEREGVSATDTTAATPLGVGESLTKGGEELAKGSKETGREDTGEKGPAARPTGTSTKEDVLGENTK
jgi:hypothetical protein